MDITNYYKSITSELESLKDRVRNFIDTAHWLTHGEWRESVVRSLLSRRLPDTVKVGRGFILTKGGPSTQCDILIYKASSPVLFKDGELVFITPDAVKGVIEVKSNTGTDNLKKVLRKFGGIGRKLGNHRSECFFALFSYETSINAHETTVNYLRDHCDHEVKILDFVLLGCSTFVRWWKESPEGEPNYYSWHSYDLKNMAAGYFMANVIGFVNPDSVQANRWLWFLQEGKEGHKMAEAEFKGKRMPLK